MFKFEAPKKILSANEIENVMYQRDIQFGRGLQAAKLLSQSEPRAWQQMKHQAALQLRNDIKGTRQMFLDHFRLFGKSNVFLTFPLRLFDLVPCSKLADALTMTVDAIETTKVSQIQQETFSLPDDFRVPLPLTNGATDEFQLQGDTDDFGVVADECVQPSFVQRDTESALVLFRLSHGAPNHLRRPLSAVDSLNTNHVCLRLYTILEQDTNGKFLHVQWDHFADIVCELFSSQQLSVQDFQHNLMSWDIDFHGVSCNQTIGCLVWFVVCFQNSVRFQNKYPSNSNMTIMSLSLIHMESSWKSSPFLFPSNAYKE